MRRAEFRYQVTAKRLVERGWLAEEAGLFALPARNGSGAGEAVKRG